MADELTDEEILKGLLEGLENSLEEALEENDDLPFTLDEVKTTRSGRVIAYFDFEED